jgi:hypothetical protein
VHWLEPVLVASCWNGWRQPITARRARGTGCSSWETTKTHPRHPRHPHPHRHPHAITMNMGRHQKTSPDKILAARMMRMVRMPFRRILEPKPAPTAAGLARCWSAQSAGKPLCCTEPASILGRGGSPGSEGQPRRGNGTRLTCRPATRFARELWPNRSATSPMARVDRQCRRRADAHSCRTRQGWQVSQRHAVARSTDPAQNMMTRGSPPGRDVPGRLVVSGPESGQADQHAPTRPRGWVSRPAADDRSGPWWRRRPPR